MGVVQSVNAPVLVSAAGGLYFQRFQFGIYHRTSPISRHLLELKVAHQTHANNRYSVTDRHREALGCTVHRRVTRQTDVHHGTGRHINAFGHQGRDVGQGRDNGQQAVRRANGNELNYIAPLWEYPCVSTGPAGGSRESEPFPLAAGLITAGCPHRSKPGQFHTRV